MAADLTDIPALVARRDDPSLIAGYQSAIRRAVAWRWTRDEVEVSPAPFALELGVQSGQGEPRWQDEPPKVRTDWAEYGFDADGLIVAWRRFLDEHDDPLLGGRWVDGDETIAVQILPDGRVAGLTIDTADEQCRITSSVDLQGPPPSDEVPLEVVEVTIDVYEYDGPRPVRLRSTAWRYTPGLPPASLTPEERAQPPWNLIPGIPEQLSSDPTVEFQAVYVGSALAEIVCIDDGDREVVWSAPRPVGGEPPSSLADGTDALEELESSFADALVDAVAADAARHPPEGPLVRAIVRWASVDDPAYLTVHLLGLDDAQAGAEEDDVWHPLEWANAERESARTERVLATLTAAEVTEQLALRYRALPESDFVSDEAPPSIQQAVARLPAALERRGVSLAQHFTAAATHFDGSGGPAGAPA